MKAEKIGYLLALIIEIVVTLTLTAMIVLQILDVRQLTLKQVGVAILAMMACAARMGGYKKWKF